MPDRSFVKEKGYEDFSSIFLGERLYCFACKDTDADLRWTNPLARCNKEKIGRKNVPIADRVEDFDEYDLVLIGFPVWYYAAPNIIETFVKSYDFSGKKVALFATSGGSDITKAPGKLQPLMKGEIIGAKLFAPDASFAEVNVWVSGLK